MKFKFTLVAIALIAAPSVLFAQQGDPMEAARALDSCNGNPPIKANWLDSGRLAVTCPKGSKAGKAAGATNFAIPIILGVLAAGAAMGGGGSSSSSTN